MRYIGNRRKQWSGYVVLALTVGVAWLTRNRPRYRTRAPYTTGAARVYDRDDSPADSSYAAHRSDPENVDRSRNRRRVWWVLPVFVLLLVVMCGLVLLSGRSDTATMTGTLLCGMVGVIPG